MADNSVSTGRGVPGPNASGSKHHGSRGTGQVYYRFAIRMTSELVRKSVGGTEFHPFHAAVYELIFGEAVRNTGFIRYEQYKSKARQTNFGDFKGFKPGAVVGYGVAKTVIDWIGIVPRLKPYRIDDGGNPPQVLPDVPGGYSEVMELNSAIAPLAKDASHIIHARTGVHVGDARVWKRLKEPARSMAISEMRQIAELMLELDDEAYLGLIKNLPDIRENYWGKAPRIDVERIVRFREHLQKLSKESKKRANSRKLQQLEVDTTETSLVGLEALYFQSVIYDQAWREEHNPTTQLSEALLDLIGEGKREDFGKVEAKYKKLLTEARISRSQLDTLIKSFTRSFEVRAASFARHVLSQHLRILEYYGARTDPAELEREFTAVKLASIQRVFNKQTYSSLNNINNAIHNTEQEFEKLANRYPLVRYVNFWEIYHGAMNSRYGKKGEFSPGWFSILVSQTRSSIRKILKELESSDYIWKGDIIVNGALKRFGMYEANPNARTHNAMLTSIVHRKMADVASSEAIKDLLLAALALALSLSGVGLLVGIGVVYSLVDVYLMAEDYEALGDRKAAGFSSEDPPSDFWILLSVAGAAADVAGIAKVAQLGRGVKLAENTAELGNAIKVVSRTDKTLAKNLRAAEKHKRKLEKALRKLEKVEESLRKAAKAADQHKSGLAEAFVDFRKVAMSAQSVGAGLTELVSVSYYLGRLGFSKFRHFVLELSRRGLLDNVAKGAEYDEVIKLLPKDELAKLMVAHKRGLAKGVVDLKRIAELDGLISEKLSELAEVKDLKGKIWKRRNKKNVPKNPSAKNSPYNTLAPEHQRLMDEAERLERLVAELRAEKANLAPPKTKRSGNWGNDVEAMTRARDGWKSMESATTKTIDSVRKARDGTIEMLQHKALEFPKQSELEKKVVGLVGEISRKFDSQNYKDLVKQFNNNTIPRGKDYFKFTLPKNWRDAGAKVIVEIRVVSDKALDLTKVREIGNARMRELFPPNAILNIQPVSPEDVWSELAKIRMKAR